MRSFLDKSVPDWNWGHSDGELCCNDGKVRFRTRHLILLWGFAVAHERLARTAVAELPDSHRKPTKQTFEHPSARERRASVHCDRELLGQSNGLAALLLSTPRCAALWRRRRKGVLKLQCGVLLE
eukprot:SAG11_NODE_4365_length_1931_cov_3.419214_3_plen_125_part_00